MIGTPEMMKRVNMNLIYSTLIETHSATRQELAEKTKISLTTIRAILEELLLKKQIIETKLDESSGGRRAQRYALNPKKNLILSFYFIEEKLVFQIANLKGEVLEMGMEVFKMDSVVLFIDQCINKWDICAIGIGVPGIVEKGKFYVGREIGGFETNPLGDMIQAKYNIPIILENDLNAIAYGYGIRYLHNHKECTRDNVNLAYIHFNKDCTGAGFVVNGKVLHGAKSFAGELGFMPIKTNTTLDQTMDCLGRFEECIDLISRTLTIINCITNPSLIVLGGNRFKMDTMKLRQLECHLRQHYLTEEICPNIILSNPFEEDYLLGLSELTLKHILPLLPFSI